MRREDIFRAYISSYHARFYHGQPLSISTFHKVLLRNFPLVRCIQGNHPATSFPTTTCYYLGLGPKAQQPGQKTNTSVVATSLWLLQVDPSLTCTNISGRKISGPRSRKRPRETTVIRNGGQCIYGSLPTEWLGGVYRVGKNEEEAEEQMQVAKKRRGSDRSLG